MYIKLTADDVKLVGLKNLEPYGVTEDNMRWRHDLSVDLSTLTRAGSEKFLALVEKHPAIKGYHNRVRDIKRWLEVMAGKNVRCKKLVEFEPLLKQYLKDAPKHWLYELNQDTGVWQPYYVSSITYIPRKEDRGWVEPARVNVTMHWEELGTYRNQTVTFHAHEVEDMTIPRILAEADMSVETDETLRTHEEMVVKYSQHCDKLGLQFEAIGQATIHESRWHSSSIRLEKDGVPSRVVIDVITEKDDDDDSGSSRSSKNLPPDAKYWDKEGCDHEGSDEDDDTDIKPGDEDSDEDTATEAALVPLKPNVMVFDLKRHARFKVHISQLTLYAYKTDLATKLILPDEVTDLVDMLVAHRGGFQDIIGNKGNGAVVLCAGAPGTGKTLTSEVYSEAMERPLYSVQCSQLGIKPDDLEKQLLKVFARAQRWNAILLLDEADVYVAARGSDLVQNAIVGVFLRVLEYYQGVLFMTTNRADLVDDAVASRCLARIVYDIPTAANQKRIWRTLADTANIELDDKSIDSIVARFPRLSGRDIKNLLKLGSMVAAAQNRKVTAKVIEFVKQFKPTDDLEAKS